MSIDNFEVVMKLIGDIEPCADTSIDNKRNENMGEFIKLYQQMGDKLRRIGDRKSKYGSAQAIHERARKACIAESLEIRLLDHILVTTREHVSFRRRGWL